MRFLVTDYHHVGPAGASLLNSAVVAETSFGFPGVGSQLIGSILTRDFNVVLAAILVAALAFFSLTRVDRPSPMRCWIRTSVTEEKLIDPPFHRGCGHPRAIIPDSRAANPSGR